MTTKRVGTRRKIAHVTEECYCEWCGCPSFQGEWITDYDDLTFCGSYCAAEYKAKQAQDARLTQQEP